MRKLLRLLIAAVAIGLIAYLIRERLVPVPKQPTADEAPRFRVAPPTPQPTGTTEPEPAAAPAAVAEAAGDDLTTITGIGPVYSGRLREAGIVDFASLASADAATLAERIDVPETVVADWISQAVDHA